MKGEQDFNISDIQIESLFAKWATNTEVTPMYSPKRPRNIFKEDPLTVLGELNFKVLKQDSTESVGTPIQEFFRGVGVFITGGSGFVGKVLTEKLVRSVPNISHVFLLIRPKKGKTCEERFEQLMNDKVFSRMKAEVPDYRTKITSLAGNIAEADLGLSAEDCQLLTQRVNVVFHCAADIRFLEPLRKVVTSNVLGSKHVMDLARNLKDLKAYVQVSTAYSQCVHRVIEEKVPKMSVNYKEFLQYINSHTDAQIEENLQTILQGWPNTYAFSKALCEAMVQDEAQDLPICIFRPSIVMSTCNEPVKGWMDNLHGPAGATVGVCLGVLHCFRVDENNVIDIIPVDYVVNCMIAVAWLKGTKRESEVLPVYNFTSSPQNTFLWRTFWKGLTSVDFWPSMNMIWFPSAMTTENYYFDKACHYLLHRVPGAVLDKLAVLSGKKPRLVKIYKSIETLDQVTTYFKNGIWEFRNDNVRQLWLSLSEEDKKLYNFDVRDIDWVEYVYICWLGARYYFFNESMDTIPSALTKIKWFGAAHTCLKVFFGFVLLKFAVFAARTVPI